MRISWPRRRTGSLEQAAPCLKNLDDGLADDAAVVTGI